MGQTASRIEAISFPVFALDWWADPSDGTSILAYAGGGGSAKTGVFNKIIVNISGEDEKTISTDEKVCAAVHVYQNPISKQKWLLGGVDKSVIRYSLPNGTQQGEVNVGVLVNAFATNAMADRMAVGCEDGTVHIFSMTDDSNVFTPIGVCEGHTKAVCSLSYALRTPLLVSSAKDGYGKVWNTETQACVSTLDTIVPLENGQRPRFWYAKGCAVGDLEGKIIYTVASSKRGKSYLSRWVQKEKGGDYVCELREECNKDPVSAMSMSCDAALLAMGDTNGTIILFDLQGWKPIMTFKEIHGLPVTGIAVRPYPIPLRGEDDGIQIDAISASADSKLAFLTRQKKKRERRERAPPASGGRSFLDFNWTSFVFWTGLVGWVFYIIVQETLEKCEDELNNWGQLPECVLHTVLIAPSTRPGVLVPPH